MSEPLNRKDLGSYYTPPEVVRTLVSWATEGDLQGPILDPSCGDGRFLAGLKNAVGVDIDPVAAAEASRRIEAKVVAADFFAWAADTRRRFAAAVGNPPFIRYHVSADGPEGGRWSTARGTGSSCRGCARPGHRSWSEPRAC